MGAFDDLIPGAAKPSAGAFEDLIPSAPKRSAVDVIRDVGVTALKGAVGLPQAVVGLADIPTGGRVGKFLEENVGYRPGETQEMLAGLYSDAQRAANAKVQDADGFVDTLKTAIDNPSTIATTIGESLPQMLGGAAVARGITTLAPKVAPWIAGALGEGVIGAGSAASRIREQTEDGLLTPKQSLAAAASGVGTAVLGAAGGKLSQKLGIGDIDTMLATKAGGALPPGKTAAGFVKAVVGGGISEGAFEELPQSAQEQMLQNYALDRPLTEGVGNAMAMGLLSGTAMGGGAGGYSAVAAKRGAPASPSTEPAARGAPAAPAGPAGTPPASGSSETPDLDRALESELAKSQPDAGATPPAAAPAGTPAQAPAGSLLDTVPRGSNEGAEALNAAPRTLTALDRVQEIDARLAAAPAGQDADLEPLRQERAELTRDWPATVPGAPASFSTETGARLEGQYALIEADDMVTSHDRFLRRNAAYPQDLQPRERERAASEMQISSISQRLDPARLGASADAATGAPIIGADGLVESGNARSIALSRVYAVDGEKAEEYRGWLRSNAEQFGLSADQVAGISKPVLVRVRRTPVNRAEFARQANASTVAAMSPTEQARSDAARLDTMDDLRPDDDGNFATSRSFISRFVGRLPATERGAMVDADGQLSSTGYARVRNAVLAKAYGESPVLAKMVESLQDDQRNVSRALLMAAPRVAQAREAIEAGRRHPADITPHLMAAVTELGRLREAGRSVDDALAQQDIGGEARTPEAATLMRFLAENARRPRRIADFLTAYHDGLDAAGDPGQASLLDDGQAPTVADLIEAAQRQVEPPPAPAAGPAAANDSPGTPAWRDFPAESGTLGIPRAKMPQVKVKVRPQLYAFLEGRGISSRSETVPPDSLKPTQAEFSPTKVQSARELTGDAAGVLVSSDGYVLDGHHRWLAKAANGEPVDVRRFDAPIDQLLDAVREFSGTTVSNESDVLREARAGAVERFYEAVDALAMALPPADRATLVPEGDAAVNQALDAVMASAAEIVGIDPGRLVEWVSERLRSSPATKGRWNRVTPAAYRKAAVRAGAQFESLGPVDQILDRYQRFGGGIGTPQQGVQQAAAMLGLAAPSVTADPLLRPEVRSAVVIETGDIVFNPKVELPASLWAQVMVEEVLHQVDLVAPGASMSATSSRLLPGGDLRQEVDRVFATGRGLAGFLSYPMKAAQAYGPERVAAELFARLGAIYHGDPALMRRELPTAYEAYHAIFGLQETGRDQFVRRALPGAGRARGERAVLLPADPDNLGGAEVPVVASGRAGAVGPGGPGNRDADRLETLRGAVAAVFGARREGGPASGLNEAVPTRLETRDGAADQPAAADQRPTDGQGDRVVAARPAGVQRVVAARAGQDVAADGLTPPDDSNLAREEAAVYAVNDPGNSRDVALDLFPETLEGLQPVPGAGGGSRAGRSSPAGLRGNVQPVAAVPNVLALREDPQLPGVYHSSTQLVQEGERELPVARVRSWSDAANALSALNRFAVEHFDALVTDKDGKPLALIGGFKGAISQAAVYPSTMLQEALRIGGAARVWGVHNHPSGNPELSEADRRLNETIASRFDASTVKWMGVAAVGRGSFQAVTADGQDVAGAIRPAGPTAKVPIVERTISPQNDGAPMISSPAVAKQILKTISKDEPGLLFVDTQLRVTGWVPVEPTAAGALRIDDRFDRLINSAAYAGASAALISNPRDVMSQRVLANLNSALSMADVRVLDAIDTTAGASAAETGVWPPPAVPIRDIAPSATGGSWVAASLARAGWEKQDVPRVQVTRRLAALVKQLESGRIGYGEFETQVKLLSWRLDQKVDAQAANRVVTQRERGADIVREKLIRGRRQGDLDPDSVELALWALDQNPALAEGLGISLVTPKKDSGAGDYNPAAEIIRLFKGAGNAQTAVHELLHHAERMMPPDMQGAVRAEWLASLARARRRATPEQLAALDLIPAAVAGNRKAYNDLVDAIQRGPLSYEAHYQFVNPSEFWAVNGARILAARQAADGSVWARLGRWMAELVEKAKAIVGMRSDAPLLRALDDLLSHDGSRRSPEMLSQSAGRADGLPTLLDLGRPTPEPTGQEPPTDPNEPRTTRAWRGLKQRAQALTSPENVAKLVYELQDKFIDLRNLRDHIENLGGTITDLNDAYLGEELYHKRLAKRTEDFLKTELRPLLSDMKARGVALETLERFLHARHAPEANRVLAERNPTQEMIDAGKEKADAEVRALEIQLQGAKARGGATRAIEEALQMAREARAAWNGAQAFKGTEEERLSLSGMSDAEAEAFIEGLPAGQRRHLDDLAGRVDAINSKTVGTLERYGLMDKATLDAWRATYQHYVPLHRDEAHPDSVSHPIGQGFSTKGDAAKRRVGSNAKVTNILAHVAMQRESALTRGEKNLVAKRLYLMASQNPAPEWWTVDKPPTIKTVDANTGFVRSGVDPLYKNRPNVVMVRIAGKDAAVVFNERNPAAARLALSIKGQDLDDIGAVTMAAGRFTRLIAAMSTQYNPVFSVVNFVRDVQGSMLNLTNTPMADRKAQVFKDIFPALGAIYGDVRASRRGKVGPKGAWVDLWQQMQEEGGTTGYRDLYADANDRVKAIESEIRKADRSRLMTALDHFVVGWVSDINEAVENAVRLAVYKAARDTGLTIPRAASQAKNITVNFNRKGRQNAKLGAWYAFFNAAIQGNTRMVETLRGPMGRRIIAGGIGLGVLNTLVAVAAMGGDGDDDEYKNLPEFVKSRNLIIPLGGKEYFTIPLPLGFHVLPNMGRVLTEFALGRREDATAGQVLGEMLAMVMDAFNPLGGSENLAMVAAPTPLDIPVGLMMNRDWQNRPISRENTSDQDPQPAHKLTRDTASAPSKALSEALNWVGGGNDYTPGAKILQWTPDQIDYVIGQLTGGLGREVVKSMQVANSAATGDELPPYKIPLIGRFYGSTEGPSGQATQYHENVKRLNLIDNEIKGRARDEAEGTLEPGEKTASEFAETQPLAVMLTAASRAERQIQALRQQRARLVRQAEPGYQDEVKRINEQIGEVMGELNREVTRVRREAKEAKAAATQ